MQLTVVSLKTSALVYWFKSAQGFYIIYTGSDVIIGIYDIISDIIVVYCRRFPPYCGKQLVLAGN